MTLSPTGLRRLEALEVLATSSKPALVFELPLQLLSRANAHVHWRKQHGRNKSHRQAATMVLSAKRGQLQAMLAVGAVVRVVRVAPANAQLDSHDNLGTAVKSLIDGIADVFDIDDRDERVSFVPDAEVGAWGARVEVYPLHEVAR